MIDPVRTGEVHHDDLGFRVVYDVHPYYADVRVYRVDDAAPIVTGSIKWDGCCNWNFDACVHFCEREHAVQLGEVLARVYDIGPLILHWST